MHFGFPHCHGASISDPEFGRGHPCSEFVPPARELGAHVAALGMSFYRGSAFPEEHRPYAYIPEHGSWNRSRAIGYRISRVRIEKGEAVSYETFVEGWLRPDGKEAWGRPVHVLETPDGDLLVSDDRAGAIYRIRFTSPPAAER
jgi:glucose/arabinose dehydrogenase